VRVIIDEKLMERELINFHPNVNTATLTISTQDLKRFLEQSGNDACVIVPRSRSSAWARRTVSINS
jgi:Ala-tRNA(Pro) deacylase